MHTSLLRRRQPSQDFQDLQGTSQDPSQEVLHLFLLLLPALPDTEMQSPAPRAFVDFFSSATPPFRPASREPCTTVRPKTNLYGSQGDTTRCCEHFTGLFPGRDPKLARGVHAGYENLLESVIGDALPQPTVGPAVPSANMGPDSLRQLSPSDDREASWAQRKAGSKRADGGVRQNRCLSSVQTRFTLFYTPALSRIFSNDPSHFAQPAGTNWDQIVANLHSTTTPRFRGVFSSDPSHIAPPAGTNWDQFVGDAPPQPTVGPTVPSENMSPIPLQ